MKKTAVTRFPILELHAERWSPRAFSARPVSYEQLGSLFEAARWAASCFNEQPWRYFVAMQSEPERFATLRSLLVPANDVWASKAPVLGLSVAKLDFTRGGKPNRHAYHDVGLATGALSSQAQSMGLALHQMGGFDVERARTALAIPAGFDPVAMMAIGYAGDPAGLTDELRERELAPRERRPLEESVYGASFGSPNERFGPSV